MRRSAQVDALDEEAIDAHLQSVIDAMGRVDISFNAVGISNTKTLGVPLLELDLEQFSRPIADYTTSYFLTARLAARCMIPNKSGVIMTVTALPGRTGTALNGGYGSAQAAKDALTRDLSTELAPQGIRVVSLRPHGMPGTRTMQEVFELKASRTGSTWEQFQTFLANWSHPRRVMRLEEVAHMTAFIGAKPKLADLASLRWPFIDRQGNAEQSYIIQLVGETEAAKILVDEKSLLDELCAYRELLCLHGKKH